MRRLRRRARGFTLAELMTVVTLVGIIASLAVMSIKRSRAAEDVDHWAALIRNTVHAVRRRAVSTGSTFMIDLGAAPGDHLSWCQVTETPGACTTTTTRCPNGAAGMENGGLVQAGSNALTDSYFAGADLATPTGTPSTSYTPAVRTTMPPTGNLAIYFGANGTVDLDYANVKCLTAPPAGFTLYLKANNPSLAPDSAETRRKIVTYGLSGRPRVLGSW